MTLATSPITSGSGRASRRSLSGSASTIPIETNVRELLYGRGLSGAAWFGFATGGLSRLVASEARTVLLASSQAHRVQLPNSSHPMIDHLWGSDQLQVVHEGGELARTEKVELIAANPIARERLRVCWQYHDGDVNCGRCEKCLRTMVALEAIGALGDFPTFPDDLDLDRVAAVRPAVRHEVAFWRENLALAREHGARADLCEAIESAIDGALPIRPSRPPAKPVGPASRVIAAEDAGLRPRAAIVIPVFRQPATVANAIRSALESRTEFEVAVVVVNDGCPYPSTEANSLRAREIDPGRTAYLAQENAGLAAARNAGVAYALETWPAAEAIFFLDADNEFGPDAIAALWRVLEDDPAASWAYAYREMFGAEGGGWEVPGGFELLRQLFENQCDAGSLVRREVFTEHEVSVDASMRTGYRDWEFFIRAMRRGLRGVPAGRCGFRYRRRAFSMVERSMREHESLLEQIRADPDAYSPRALARREHEALPRFALVDPSLGSVELTASVELPPGSSTLDELIAASDLDSDSSAAPAPAVTVLGSHAAFAWLRAERLGTPPSCHGPASPVRPRQRRPEAPRGRRRCPVCAWPRPTTGRSSARDSAHREAGRRLGAGHRWARHRARGGRPCAIPAVLAGWRPDLGDGRRAEHGSRATPGAPRARPTAGWGRRPTRGSQPTFTSIASTTLPWTGEPVGPRGRSSFSRLPRGRARSSCAGSGPCAAANATRRCS